MLEQAKGDDKAVHLAKVTEHVARHDASPTFHYAIQEAGHHGACDVFGVQFTEVRQDVFFKGAVYFLTNILTLHQFNGGPTFKEFLHGQSLVLCIQSSSLSYGFSFTFSALQLRIAFGSDGFPGFISFDACGGQRGILKATESKFAACLAKGIDQKLVLIVAGSYAQEQAISICQEVLFFFRVGSAYGPVCK